MNVDEFDFDDDDDFDDEGLDDMIMVVIAQECAYSSSSEEDGEERGQWGGSVKGRAPNKARDFGKAYENLVKQYFSGPSSIYDETDFQRRFRMPRSVFDEIQSSLIGKGCFVQKYDATKKPGIHPLVRLVACLRKICYGGADDRLDENFQISESALSPNVKEFTRLMKQEFGKEHSNRMPTAEERARLTEINSRRGFPGMFASWDCKHFVWHNCPMELQGQHRGKEADETLVLEAICDADLYIWYHFFGEAGSLNDLNILDKSSIVGAMLGGKLDLKTEPYMINGRKRDYLYFLTDGIYPKWAIFCKPNPVSLNEKQKHYSYCQESVRKDIERAFGVLVQQFQILANPIRFKKWSEIVDLLDCCIILHNMVVAARRSSYAISSHLTGSSIQQNDQNTNDAEISSIFGNLGSNQAQGIGDAMAARSAAMSDSTMSQEAHLRLKEDLEVHLWEHKQNS